MEAYRSEIILTNTQDDTVDPPKATEILLQRYSSIRIVDDIESDTSYMDITIPYVYGMEYNDKYLKSPARNLFTDFKSDDSNVVKLTKFTTGCTAFLGFEPVLSSSKPDKINSKLTVIQQENVSFIGVSTDIIKNDTEITLHFEDSSFWLKRKRFNIAFKGGSLKDFVKLLFEKSLLTMSDYTLYEDTLLTKPVPDLYVDEDAVKYFTKEVELDSGISAYTNKVAIPFVKYEVDTLIDDMLLPPITINNNRTAYEIFEMLKEKFGIYSYFKLMNKLYSVDLGLTDKELLDAIKKKREFTSASIKPFLIFHSGFKYTAQARVVQPSTFTYPYLVDQFQPIIANVNEDNLEYTTSSVAGFPILSIDTNVSKLDKLGELIVVAKSTFKDKTITVITTDGKEFFTTELMDTSGMKAEEKKKYDKIKKKTKEEIDKAIEGKGIRVSLNLPEVSILDLQKLALNKWNSVPADTLTGSVTVFGYPIVAKSDRVRLFIDGIESVFYVDKVEKTFDMNEGLLQRIYFTNKLY